MTAMPETEAPEETALYHIWGEASLLLYIGISNDFGRRWKQHAKRQPWWNERRRMTTLWFDSREDAEGAEAAAIKAEKPKYNKLHAVPPAPRVRKPAVAASRVRVTPQPISFAWWEEMTLGPFMNMGAYAERCPAGYRGVLRDGLHSSPVRWRCEHVHEDRSAARSCASGERLRRSRAYVGERFAQPLTLAEVERHYAGHVTGSAA